MKKTIEIWKKRFALDKQVKQQKNQGWYNRTTNA